MASKNINRVATRPNLFLIGGMRCGSTSLNLILSQHPDIFMSPIKEPKYYVAEAMRRIPNATSTQKLDIARYEAKGRYRTSETYSSLFDKVGNERIVGESSQYLFHTDVIPTILADSPNARILVSLRDPVDRLFSEYQYMSRRGKEIGSFSFFAQQCLDKALGGNPIQIPSLAKGLQGTLLAPWIESFGRENVKVILFEDLKSDFPAMTKSIFDWLGVATNFEPLAIHAQKGGAFRRNRLVGIIDSQMRGFKRFKQLIPRLYKEKIRAAIYARVLERPEMDNATRRSLNDFYRQDVDALENIIGQKLDGWLQNGDELK